MPELGDPALTRAVAVLFTLVLGGMVAGTPAFAEGTGTFTGTVFVDRNGNGAVDPGEGLRLVEVALNLHLRRTTDDQGRFEFRDVPAGRYFPSFTAPGGWRVDSSQMEVIENATIDVPFAARRPTFETLTATMAFTKASYTAGATAFLKVTLTNKGSTPLTEIGARCNSHEGLNDIGNDAGWGPLARNQPGVTLPAGESRTFDVSSPVPEGAAVRGRVFAGCEFGRTGQQTETVVFAAAKVPGLFGTVRSRLIYDKNKDRNYDGDGVADTKVILVDVDTGVVAARAVTDGLGRVEFRDAPAGRYELRPLGPWKILGTGEREFDVLGGQSLDHFAEFVEPGPVQPDPDAPPDTAPPPPAPEEPPAPQADAPPASETGGTGPTLANTGAAATLGLVTGLAALLIGVGMVVAGRRRAG